MSADKALFNQRGGRHGDQSHLNIHGVIVPPELIAGFVILLLALLSGGTLIVRSASRSFANALDRAEKKREADFEAQNEKRKIELDNLKRESAENASAYQFVLSTANKLSDRVDQQDKLVADLQAGKENALRQLEEARTNSMKRDQEIGELRAMLSKTASERDQERIQRETLESQRNAAVAQVEEMKQKIKDLEAKTAEMDKLAMRVEELEKRQQERHDLANELQAKISEAEHRAQVAEQKAVTLISELEAERRKTQQFATPIVDTPATPEPKTDEAV